MSVFGTISRALFYLAFLHNVVECADWVNDVTKYILQRPELRVAHFITNHGESGSIRNPQIDELLINVMSNLPVQRIDFDQDFKLPSTLVNDERKTPFDTSTALYILVIESRDVLPIPRAKRFLGAVADLTTIQTTSNFLIVTSASKSSDNLEELLQYGWTKKILDLTIIELIESNEVPRYAMAIDRPITSHIVKHQLNPFKKEYTKEAWTSDIDKLFPKKTKDLHGFPLKVAAVELVDVLPDCYDFPTNFLSIIQKRLNCSLDVTYATWSLTQLDYFPTAIKVLLELDSMELIATLLPDYPGAWRSFVRTVPVVGVDSSFLVPFSHTSVNSISMNFIGAYCLIFGIILIFWAFMRLLGHESYPWRAFNIGRVLFGVGISHQPRTKVGRIIFGCLLCVSAFYASTMYTSITDIVTQKNVPVKFGSFQDLIDSKLTLGVNPYDWQRVSDFLIGPLEILRNRTNIAPKLDDCLRSLVLYKNVSCLMDQWTADFVARNRAKGQPLATIAKPPLWNDAYSFIVANKSPYRSSFDDIILRLQSSGLVNKYCNMLDRTTKMSTESTIELESSDALLRQLLTVAIVGYSLAIIVFIAEILVHRIFMRKRSKTLMIHQPLYPYSQRKASRNKKVNAKTSKVRPTIT